ncbi:MAG: hypothetical protein IMZ60_04995 [Actinobacteria bacterium]|nr:hypothetical protein [Actinomycetota bacterium]
MGGTPPYTNDALPIYGSIPGLDNLILAIAFSIASAVGLETMKIIANDGNFMGYKDF